jgi:oligosaccharyltransferase complex subunit alpha (ribophorin I)
MANSSGIVNNRVQREINFSGPNLKQSVTIEFSNDSKEDITEYILVIPKEHAENLAQIDATIQGETLNVVRDDSISTGSDKYTPFRVTLNEKLQPGDEARLILSEEYGNRKLPFPPTMKLKDTPKVRVIDDAYYPTLYPTKKMKSTFEVGEESTIIKATEIDSGEVRGRSVRYGTYKDVKPLHSHPIFIHVNYDSPIPVFTKASREVTLSHWSSIGVEEEYKMTNNVAKLNGEFGRIDFNPYQTKYALTNMYCELPYGTTNLYYTDEIGNITSSRATREDGKVKFSLEPRFPLMGGWKTYWKQTYNLPRDQYITETSKEQFEFKINFSHPFDDIVAEDFEFSIVLPEGASDVTVDYPFEMDGIQEEVVYRYLDLKGRKKLIFTKKNVVEHHHDKTVRVTYKLSEFDHYMKPLILIIYTFILLFVLQLLYACTSGGPAKVKRD